MRIRTKLIALLLAIALVPSAAIGVFGLQNMQQIGDFAKDESTTQLEGQITGELNSTITARQEEFKNLLSAREVDARSLAQSSPVQNFHAASQGEMELVREQSQQQLGYVSLQMRSTIDNTKERVLEAEYGGQSYENLSSAEQADVKEAVERILAGTTGDGTAESGAFYDSFQPGYISDTGYVYVTDLDSNIVMHHDLEDGFSLIEDAGGTLTVFRDIKSTVQSNAEIRNGERWGVAEYDFEDTTQEGNPVEEKFISYTYYEDFDWIIAPNVYYYELQTTAVADARDGIEESFESYLETRTIAVDGEQLPAYDQIRLIDADGNGIFQSERTENGEIRSESIRNQSYGVTTWFEEASSLNPGEVYVGEIRTQDGKQVMRIVTPVYYDGEFAGVVSLRFDYGIITSVASDITVANSGYVSIAAQSGRVVSHPDETVIADRASIVDEEYAGGLAAIAESRILAGEQGLETYPQMDNGEEANYFVAFAPVTVGQTQLSVLATVPEEDVTAPVTALGDAMAKETTSARNIFLLLFGVVGVVVLGVGYRGSEMISAPITSVRDRAQALARGEFTDGVESTSRDDEIGELRDAFEDMESNLRDLFGELDDVSQNLQQGTLDQDIDSDYPGTYGDIMETLDEGSQQLTGSFGEIRQASDNLRTGSLDQEIDTDRPGDYGEVLGDLETGANQMSASFEQILAASDGLETGRLTHSFDTDVPGAYGDALQNLEAGFAHVSKSIAEVQEIADAVANTSQEVRTSTEEIETASQEVADSVQEISHGAEQQSENLNQATSELNDLSATVEEIASSATEVAETASDTAEKGEAGRENASKVTTEIGRIEGEAESAVEQVSSLDEEMDQIGEVVRMINEIAEQTNLLALNASIEAARAGEAGEGFAVVADEIKSLAGEAADATAEIEDQISEVQETTNDTVDNIQEMRTSVESSTKTIEETIAIFDDIAESIDGLEDGVTEISDATDDQAASTEEIVAMVDEVSTVSEETAAEASNVSAASEEQASSLSEVGENVGTLSNASENLFNLVEQFQVREDGAQDNRDAGNRGSAAADGGSMGD